MVCFLFFYTGYTLSRTTIHKKNTTFATDKQLIKNIHYG